MKRILSLGWTLLVLLVLSGLLFAQAPKPDTTKPSQVTPAKTAPAVTPAKNVNQAKSPSMAMSHMVSGKVVSVDVAGHTLVVKGKKSEVKFDITPQTKISMGGKAATLVEVNKDSHVTVTYKVEGNKKIATEIR